MQRQQILAVSGITAAVLAVGGGIAIAMSGSGSATPPASPADQGAVVQITDTPSTTSSVAVTTTKAAATTSAKVEVKTTEQAAATTKRTVQQRQAAADEPADTTPPEQTLASGETSTTPATQYRPTPCNPTETSPDCLDDGLHNGSA